MEDIPEVEMKMLVSKVRSNPSNLAKNIYPIGTRMAKVFYIEEQKCNELCYGEIIRYNMSKGKDLYSVLYDDGDEDDISEAEMKMFVNNATRKQPNKTNSAPRIFCSYKGCSNQERNKGLCIRHGATKRKLCNYKGCCNQSRGKGVCVRHGAPKQIYYPGRVRKICSRKKCTTFATKSGVCWRHGGRWSTKKRVRVRDCTYEGCTKWAQRRGLCNKHGVVGRKIHANIKDATAGPRKEGFAVYIMKGVCIRHGNCIKEKRSFANSISKSEISLYIYFL